jgi:hypothetical protein
MRDALANQREFSVLQGTRDSRRELSFGG